MSDDLISRQAVIAFLQSIPYIKEHPNMGELMKEWIEQIPGGQPKTGRWIFEKGDGETCVDGYICSACGRSYHTKVPYFSEFHFCPNCGAKMESEE